MFSSAETGHSELRRATRRVRAWPSEVQYWNVPQKLSEAGALIADQLVVVVVVVVVAWQPTAAVSRGER